MTNRDERCCPATDPCVDCLAYFAWLNRDLDNGVSATGDGRNNGVTTSSESRSHAG
jgi:hypothetical protein